MPHTKLASPIDMEVGPDGKIYILEYGNGWFSKNADAGISRIDYNAGELPSKRVNKTVTVAGGKSSSDTTYKDLDKADGSLGHKEGSDVPKGEALVLASDCKACHATDKKSVGPSYKEVAKRYKDNKDAVALLSHKIINGGSGVWGEVAMAAHPSLKEDEANEIVKWILSL
ncbi:c-type cytochrome [Sphingobacterium sp. SG20118]